MSGISVFDIDYFVLNESNWEGPLFNGQAIDFSGLFSDPSLDTTRGNELLASSVPIRGEPIWDVNALLKEEKPFTEIDFLVSTNENKGLGAEKILKPVDAVKVEPVKYSSQYAPLSTVSAKYVFKAIGVDCNAHLKQATEEERRAAKREKDRERQRSLKVRDPEKYEAKLERQRSLKVRDPEKYAAFLAKKKDKLQASNQDPETHASYLKEMSIRNKAKYQRRKQQDPEGYAEYIKRQREKRKAGDQKKSAEQSAKIIIK